jgi:hypothetical protein
MYSFINPNEEPEYGLAAPCVNPAPAAVAVEPPATTGETNPRTRSPVLGVILFDETEAPLPVATPGDGLSFTSNTQLPDVLWNSSMVMPVKYILPAVSVIELPPPPAAKI